jgi:c(7)-type cytochrome triheme protein
MLAASRPLAVTKRQLAFAVPVLFLICAGTISNSPPTYAVVDEFTTGSSSSSHSGETLAQDYSKFSHSRPREHADLMGRTNCVSCHRRSDSSPSPRLPVHRDCTGCHLVQFTASASSDNPICTICHTKDGLNSSNPPTKTFPGLNSFNAKFDHAQHMLGIESARPGEGCVACHTPTNRGVAESIPARLNAHQTCYQCHSPGKQASNFSSCGSCHDSGRYSRTPTTARAYRVGFSHADHKVRTRLTCGNCHTVLGRGLPQARQVSSILPAQHNSNTRVRSCVTCHNGQRAFGDRGPGFSDCGRCHKGFTFRA